MSRSKEQSCEDLRVDTTFPLCINTDNLWMRNCRDKTSPVWVLREQGSGCF